MQAMIKKLWEMLVAFFNPPVVVVVPPPPVVVPVPPIVSTTAKDAQALTFGKYASPEAKDYFNKTPTQEEKATRAVYDNVQKLVAEDKKDEALAIIDSMTDAEYEAYKKIRTAEKAKATKLNQVRLLPVVKQVQELVAAGKTDEAQAIVDQLSDEDYRLYTLAKKKLQ